MPSASARSHNRPSGTRASAKSRYCATSRRLYRERFHDLPEGERTKLAAAANGADLSALCYDPLPSVIRAVLENPLTGPEQARLIAAHHASSTGLDLLLARADLARDAEVQRRIWRNPQLKSLSDPFLLPNMETAISRILAALDRHERIVLFGDYDVDGITSLALLAETLRAYGASPNLFLPSRMEEPPGTTRMFSAGGMRLRGNVCLSRN